MFHSPFVINPAFQRCRNIPVLALLRAAADQDRKPLSVLAEVDAVAGAKINLVFENAATDTLDVRKIYCSSRVSAMATLATAIASKLANHLVKRFVPCSLM
jgi:hypothetical protein